MFIAIHITINMYGHWFKQYFIEQFPKSKYVYVQDVCPYTLYVFPLNFAVLKARPLICPIPAGSSYMPEPEEYAAKL